MIERERLGIAAIAMMTMVTQLGCGEGGSGPGLGSTAISPVTSRGPADALAIDLLPAGDVTLLGDGLGGRRAAQLLVDAYLSDGSVRDVTEQATFTVLDPTIARVGPTGRVEGLRDGTTTLDVTARAASGAVRHLRRRLVVDGARPAPGPGGEPVRVEVWPAARVLTLVDAARGREQTQRLALVLVHSDGTRRDVTDEATFEVLDAGTGQPSTAAGVDPDGRVRGLQDGVTVDVRAAVPLAHLAAAARLTLGPSTAPLTTASVVWKGEPLVSSTNPIDVAAVEALRAAGVEPGPLASDEEWLRRATADACGRLPTEAERATFLADQALDKRERTLRALLASPDLGTHWAGVVTGWLELDGSDAFRDAVALDLQQGMSLADVLRRILTGAPGVTPERDVFEHEFRSEGEGGRMRPEQLFYAFAGMSIRCGQCHDHKLAPQDWKRVPTQQVLSFLARTPSEAELYGSNGAVIEPAWPALLDPTISTPIPSLGGVVNGRYTDRSIEDRRAALADLLTTSRTFHRGTGHRVWAHLKPALLDPRSFIETPRAAIVQARVLDALEQAMRDARSSLPAFLEVVMSSRVYQLSSEGLSTKDDALLARHPVERNVALSLERGAHETIGVGLPFASDGFFLAQLGGRVSRAMNLAQPLVIMNGPLPLPGTWLETLADDVDRGRRTLDEALDSLFRRALGRDPTATERAAIAAQVQGLPAREALEDVVMALLETAEFALRR
jgi:hypothetical protein